MEIIRVYTRCRGDLEGKKFLDPAVLLEAVTQVGELAKTEGVRIALVGGFALRIYGSDVP